jgi:hypothetical protein
VGGDTCDVHAPGAVFDDDERVEAAEEDRLDVGEVDSEDRVGLRGEELGPGRSGSAGCGIYSGGLQDLPDRGRGDAVAKSDEFAVDSSVYPQVGFSRSSWRTTSRTGCGVIGRPGRRRR